MRYGPVIYVNGKIPALPPMCKAESDEINRSLIKEEEISRKADFFFLKDAIYAGGGICYLILIHEMLRY